jgi:uncharacterized membrane protein YbhN (UPF0104 family)
MMLLLLVWLVLLPAVVVAEHQSPFVIPQQTARPVMAFATPAATSWKTAPLFLPEQEAPRVSSSVFPWGVLVSGVVGFLSGRSTMLLKLDALLAHRYWWKTVDSSCEYVRIRKDALQVLVASLVAGLVSVAILYVIYRASTPNNMYQLL